MFALETQHLKIVPISFFLDFNNMDMAQVFVVKLNGFVLFCYIKRHTMLQP